MKKVISKLLIILFLVSMYPSHNTKTIPPIKGLNNVLKENSLAFGQALFYSNWIKYFYIYGPDNELRKLIRRFWHILEDDDGKPKESEPLKVTQLFKEVQLLTPKLFGKFMAFYVKGASHEELADFKKEWLGQEDLGEKEKELKEKKDLIQTKRRQLRSEVMKKVKKEQVQKKESGWFWKEVNARIDTNEDLRQLRNEVEKLKEIVKKIKIEANEKFKKRQEDAKKDIDKTLQLMINAAISDSDKYMPGTLPAIFWAFFEDLFKDDGNAIKECLQEMKKALGQEEAADIFSEEYIDEIDDEKFYEDWFTKEDFKKFDAACKGDATKKLEYVMSNYDEALQSLIYSVKMGKFSPKVPTARKTYEYDKKKNKKTVPFGVCFETAFLDMINLLWFRPYETAEGKKDEKRYDDSFFPNKGEGFKIFQEILRRFDKKGIIKPENIKETPVIEEWIRVISNLPGMYYKRLAPNGKVYEIVSSIDNFETLFNWFFGTKTTKENLQSFSDALTIPDVRIVTFEKNKDHTSKPVEVRQKGIKDSFRKKLTNQGLQVNIQYIDSEKDVYNYSMVFDAQAGHAVLNCEKRDVARPDIYDEKFVECLLDKIIQEDGMDKFNKLTSFFTLLTSPELLQKKEVEKNDKLRRLIYYTLYLENTEIKIEVLPELLYEEDNDLEFFAKEVAERSLENEHLVAQVFLQIISFLHSLEEYSDEFEYLMKKYPFEAVKQMCYTVPQALSKELISFATITLIPKIKGDVINKIDDQPTLLSKAIKQGHLDLVKALVKHPDIKIDEEVDLAEEKKNRFPDQKDRQEIYKIIKKATEEALQYSSSSSGQAKAKVPTLLTGLGGDQDRDKEEEEGEN